MALLATAADVPFVVWHVDHGLRSTSGDDARLVKNLTEELGVGFELRSVSIARPLRDLEARARHARYGALPADVCVAHTADDRAETVLLNLFRGAGPAGVAAPFDRVNRPVLSLRRSELLALCHQAGVSFAHDEHNVDPAFRRVRVRAELLPLVADIFNRDPVPLLNRYADLSGAAAGLVAAAAALVDPTDVDALKAVPPVVAGESLRRWIQTITGEQNTVDRASIERLMSVVDGSVVAAEVAGGHRVSRSRGRLSLASGQT